ncbi:MAG TPA: GNAT family N-acetyltransferase [Roseiflexaceae bacterium]
MPATIRPATIADLPELYDIWYASEVGDDPHPPPRGAASVILHELETGEVCAAEQAGQVVGFAAMVTRDGVVFVAECFVRADCQSAGVGRRLLQQLLPRDGRTCCTLSSRDPRALALYIRAGMRPQWPNFCLRAEASRLGSLPAAGVEVVEGHPGDPALLHWDAAIGGRLRPQEHDYWVAQTRAVPLWFRRAGQTVGYGYAQLRSPEDLWFPDAITLGPIGAETDEDALACVGAAVGWARPRAQALKITVPGPHVVLPALLDAHFQITYVETFVSSSDEPFADARHYIPSGSTLF